MKIENIHGFDVDVDKPYLTMRALYDSQDFSLQVLPEHVRCNDVVLRRVAAKTIREWEAHIAKRRISPTGEVVASLEVVVSTTSYLWVGTPRGSGGYWYSKLTIGGHEYMDEVGMRKQLGINTLTGEADKTCSGRILCDIAPELREEFREFFGLTSVEMPGGWNNSEHLSLMLTHEVILPFVVWCARRRGFWAIHINPSPSPVYYVFTKDEGYVEKYRESELKCYILAPIVGATRNVHQFSGRLT